MEAAAGAAVAADVHRRSEGTELNEDLATKLVRLGVAEGVDLERIEDSVGAQRRQVTRQDCAPLRPVDRLLLGEELLPEVRVQPARSVQERRGGLRLLGVSVSRGFRCLRRFSRGRTENCSDNGKNHKPEGDRHASASRWHDGPPRRLAPQSSSNGAQRYFSSLIVTGPKFGPN